MYEKSAICKKATGEPVALNFHASIVWLTKYYFPLLNKYLNFPLINLIACNLELIIIKSSDAHVSYIVLAMKVHFG